MQHIAKEGRCFVVNCNQFCKVSDFPSDYPPFAAENPSDCKANGEKWENDDVLSHGGSCVVGPLGTFLADPVWDREEIVYVELRMGDLTEARTNFDPVYVNSLRPLYFLGWMDSRVQGHVSGTPVLQTLVWYSNTFLQRMIADWKDTGRVIRDLISLN